MKKVPTANRVLAKLIDLAIVFFVGGILPGVVGPLLGFIYSICADGMHFGSFRGQSIGKKIFGLKVIHVPTQNSISIKDSAIRNLPVGVVTFFAIIPVWGWLILFLVGIPLMFVEIYLMARIESGHRLGDVMADTEVIVAESEKLQSDSTDTKGSATHP